MSIKNDSDIKQQPTKNKTSFDKIKKYAPIIVTSAVAVALGAVTGGLGFVVAGVIVAGVLYINNADAFKQQLDKHAGPKINRSLQFEKDILINGQSINGLETFKISKKDHKLDKKSYLMIGEGDNANLYYINSEGIARKMQLNDPVKFKRYIESQKKILNYPAEISPNPVLDQIIQDHVIPDKLQTTRHILKKVIAGIGLALAVAGVLAALPFVGIPMSGVLAITILGLGIALAVPFIGRFLKNMFHKGESEQDSELIINKATLGAHNKHTPVLKNNPAPFDRPLESNKPSDQTQHFNRNVSKVRDEVKVRDEDEVKVEDEVEDEVKVEDEGGHEDRLQM